MHRNFKAISISHKTAPVGVREGMALNSDETKQVLEQIHQLFSLKDVLVLSTCNRTEVYYASTQDLAVEMIKILAIHKGLVDAVNYYDYFLSITDHDDTVDHLLRVATGLESQIVGDMQITNQVKTAYQIAADANMAGPFLHRLLHTAFFTNKKVVQETAFRDGAASVSYAAMELISELTMSLEAPTIMLVGLGDIGSDLCLNISSNKHFQNYQVLLANRTHEKAASMATECGFTAIPFASFDQYLEKSDVVVSAVNSPELLIDKQLISSIPVRSYKYFIDLSMPRSIEAGIEAVHGVLQYNVDDIQSRANEALKKRLASIPKVETLVADAIVDFDDWSKDMSVNPTINKLKNALEQIRQEEISRYLKDAPNEEALKIEKLTKSIMQKVIKLPVLQLKAACRRGEAETLIDVLNDLFNLEKETQTTNK